MNEQVNKTGVVNIQVEPVFTDERGSIFDLVEEQIGHVGMVMFKPGAIRGNHYHKISVQYSYILKGELELTTANANGSDKQMINLAPGMLTRIPPNIIHTYKALSDSEMLDIVTLSRTDDGYESDTVRVKIV